MIDGPDIDRVHIRARGRCSKSGSLVGGDAPGCHASHDEDSRTMVVGGGGGPVMGSAAQYSSIAAPCWTLPT
jgi:hypothetical protein